MQTLANKRVVVVGLGRSGAAAASLCLRLGASVVGTDEKPKSELSEAARALPIAIHAGGHAPSMFEDADLIVVSPGVPEFSELARAARRGQEVIGELELGFRFISAPLCAVGGTNGKSTTTSLLGELLVGSGKRVFVGGNLGTPLSEAVGADFDVLVVEVSSFQLERAPTFRPHVSILLNVTEDHLDRYSDFESYAHAKGNAFVNQTSDDVAVVRFGDAVCEAQARRGGAKLLRFGDGGEYRVLDRSVVETATRERFELAESELHGKHNHENAAAAIAAARAFSADAGALQRGLSRFRALPHRMARCGRIAGVSFYDDSKATNVGAAVTALLGLSEGRGVVIAGGRDKLGSFEPLVDALAEKARAVVLIGEAQDRLAQAIGARVVVERASSMREAVEKAFSLSHPGDAVLLSPACSSFDMFQSYADRGDQFARAVSELSALAKGAS